MIIVVNGIVIYLNVLSLLHGYPNTVPFIMLRSSVLSKQHCKRVCNTAPTKRNYVAKFMYKEWLCVYFHYVSSHLMGFGILVKMISMWL